MTLTNFPNGIETSQIVSEHASGTSADFVVATAAGTGADSGSLAIVSGDASGNGHASGNVTLQTGTASDGATRGDVNIRGGSVSLSADAQAAVNAGQTGAYLLTNTDTASGPIGLTTGNASAGNSGDITLQTGTASGTRGNVVINAGQVTVVGLPTADPHVVGALWIDTAASRVLKVSAGP